MKLPIGYQYNLNSLKVIEVKDSFLTLEKKVRECQKESIGDCSTTKFLNSLLNKCQCLPFQLKFLYDEVKKNLELMHLPVILKYLQLKIFRTYIICYSF